MNCLGEFFTVIFRPLRPLRPFDFAQDMLCARESEFRLRLCRARLFEPTLSPGFRTVKHSTLLHP